ncbi:MAG: glutathione ABC transporter substrate-binding protein [Armatimonadota bacterium]|nr:glutathione ABC transporter substrate-binding protein [Armatimonadota bacterium]MDR7457971.1 glutathione ABC transporter substrate-binding protein [Armatimonadota bacterium]MDR7497052.1 glutathione ABC transporter substrate-binding protein [Armatimonadota bacterium]
MHRLLVVLATIVLTSALGFSAAAAPAVAPTRGGTLIVGSGTDATTLDGHLYTDSPTATIMEHMTETLYELSPEGRVQPRLALSHTVSPDGRTWTFRLRPNVRFHDGTTFDAAAAKFNLDRVLNPATRAPWRFLIDRVTEVTAVDSTTLRLVTNAPFAPLLAHLTHSGLAMQSPTAIQRLGADYARQPVGTGPFRFREWVRGDRVVVTRFDDYWGEKALLDEVQFRVIPDDGARLAALEAGSLHVAVRVPPREIERLRAGRDPIVRIDTSLRTIFVAFNVTRPPFSDRRLRQALNYAVNKRAIVQSALAGTARVSDAPIAPNVQGYSPVPVYDWDTDRAASLLREAGYSRERPLRAVFHHPTGRYIRDAEIAASIQGLARRVGIELELRTLEFGAYIALTARPREQNDIQMYMLGWGTVTGDADYGLYALFHSSQWPPVGFNRGFYKNDRVDQLLDRARVTVDQSQRNQMYAEAMRLIAEDAAWLFLHSESQVTGVRAAVQGLIVHPGERVMAHQAWLRR